MRVGLPAPPLPVTVDLIPRSANQVPREVRLPYVQALRHRLQILDDEEAVDGVEVRVWNSASINFRSVEWHSSTHRACALPTVPRPKCRGFDISPTTRHSNRLRACRVRYRSGISHGCRALGFQDCTPRRTKSMGESAKGQGRRSEPVSRSRCMFSFLLPICRRLGAHPLQVTERFEISKKKKKTH